MSEVYNVAVQRYLTDDGMDWEGITDYRMLLFKAATGPTFDATHATVADVLAHVDNVECDCAYTYERALVGYRSVTNDGRATQAHIDQPVDFGYLDNEEVGGALIFIHVSEDADSIPVAFLTSDDFPITANGAGFTIDDGADGLFEAVGVAAG
jgi:hypothetical protein